MFSFCAQSVFFAVFKKNSLFGGSFFVFFDPLPESPCYKNWVFVKNNSKTRIFFELFLFRQYSFDGSVFRIRNLACFGAMFLTCFQKTA